MKPSDEKLFLEFENESQYCKKAYKDEVLDVVENLFECKERVDVLQLFLPILTPDDLDEKLKEKLQSIKNNNIKIEVFLRENFGDNTLLLKEFFKEFGTVYFFKDKK